jgi:3-oxocholest-4-en-26-oyl-CoA dehydrogenase beta subunit
MDFSYSEEQCALRELAGRLLAARFTDEYRRQFVRLGADYDRTLWAQLAEAGLLGTAVAAGTGGSGLGHTELGLLLEEQGRTLAALPLLPTLVLGAMPLQQFGTPPQRELLREVASGALLLTAAFEEPGTSDASQPAMQAERTAEGWRLSGVKSAVPYGAQAQLILVAASTGRGAQLFLIEPGARGVTIEPQVSTSGEPQARLTLTQVSVGAGQKLGEEDGSRAVQWTLERAQVALAAEQLGVVSEALRRTAAYASERRQFARPIGSFQAVQHRLADSYIDVEALRSVYLRAGWALDHGVDASAEIAAAKWWAARAGHRVTHAAQHVHGGLGADVEYPIHAYFLRARQLGMALGGGMPMLAAIGAQLAAGTVPAFT